MGLKINHIIQHLPKVGSGVFCFLSGDAADETGEADAAVVVVVGRLDVDGFENESAAALVDGFLGAVYFDSFDFAALGAEGGGWDGGVIEGFELSGDVDGVWKRVSFLTLPSPPITVLEWKVFCGY